MASQKQRHKLIVDIFGTRVNWYLINFGFSVQLFQGLNLIQILSVYVTWKFNIIFLLKVHIQIS